MVAFDGDGVYAHCKVTEKLEDQYKKKLIYIWDPMHKAVTVDTSLMSGKKGWMEPQV